MNQIASDIDRKLRLTAALVGAVTRKDLAAAFRRVNPQTSFDVERAHKWLQGRSKPREQRVYEDWALVLDIGRPGAWIPDCSLSAFIEALCQRKSQDREQLLRRAEAFGGGAVGGAVRGHNAVGAREAALVGRYVCYSHAWSPYFQGRIIRAAMTIQHQAGALTASYAETLPTGRMVTHGAVDVLHQAIHLHLREAERGAAFLFSLFPATPPVSALGGLMCGPTILGPEPQPSVTRIVIVRLATPHPLLTGGDAYLPPGASIAEDLATMGAPVSDVALIDRRLADFLSIGAGGVTDRAPVAAYRALVEILDRDWITQTYSPE